LIIPATSVDVRQWLGTTVTGDGDWSEMQTDLDATLADTNELQTDWANGGRLDLIVDAILDDTDLIDDGTSGLAKIATDVAAILVDTSTTLQGELDGIQADTEDIQSKIGTPAGVSVSADIAAVKAETASILDDTDLIDDATSGLAKIATDVAAILVDTGTTLDDLIDAIKAKTDSLTFTVAGQVDSNIESVNGTTVTGSGTEGDPWGP
jgi:hypothetical protein